MKTKSLFILLMFFYLSTSLSAQEKESQRIHQIGINFGGLNNFGVHYKTGNHKTLLRCSGMMMNFNINKEWGAANDSLSNKYSNAGVGLLVGFEKSLPLAPNFEFLWGLEAGLAFQYDGNNYSTQYPDGQTTYWSLRPGIYGVLGVSYTLNEHFVFGAEIAPGLWYSFGKRKVESNGEIKQEFNSRAIGFGFNTGSASLSIAYRFGKK